MTLSKAAAEQAAISDVFSGRDSEGTNAPPEAKAVETQVEAPKEEAKTEAPPAPSPEKTEQPQQQHHVPLSELMTEREKRKQEARMREEADANARKYRDQVEVLERKFLAQANQRQQPEPPDPIMDPVGALNFQTQQFEVRRLDDRAHFSERQAVKAYGKDIVEEARNAAIKAGVSQHFYRNSVDPYDDVVAWHKEQKFKAEVGSDPEAYKKRLLDQARTEVLAELKAGGTQQPKTFPGSLADATQAGQQGGFLTPEAAISGVFAPDRRRR